MLIAGAEWIHSRTAIRPYWWVRTFTGISMDVGMSLLIVNLMRTALARRTVAA